MYVPKINLIAKITIPKLYDFRMKLIIYYVFKCVIFFCISELKFAKIQFAMEIINLNT